MSDPVAVAVMIGIVGALSLYGLLLMGLGFALVRNPQGWLSLGKRRRTVMLHTWIPSLRWAAPEQQRDLFDQVTRLVGWAQCGAGVGVFAGSLGACALMLALVALGPSYEFTLLVTLVIPALDLSPAMGAALGFRFGVRSARGQRPPDGALWEPRCVEDYRASWLVWALAVVSMAFAVAYPVIALEFPLLAGSSPIVPPVIQAQPALNLLAVFALLGPLVAWLSARWIATAPRAIFSPFAGVASDAEDYVRARMGAFTMLLIVRALARGVFVLAVVFLFALPAEYTGLTLAIGALGFAGLVVGGLIPRAGGRLGGRRTGWPWRPWLGDIQASV